MSKISAADFVNRVEQIAAEGPAYEKGYDGSRGLCDCIGLIIGGIRRAGGDWQGLHGSNYAARKEMESLEKIEKIKDLVIGEVVYKSYEKGEPGWTLDKYTRYLAGGKYYNGDLRDYYHVGVVVSVEPLRIRHMTTPQPKMDTTIGKWKWHGRLKKIDYGSTGSSSTSGGGGTLPREDKKEKMSMEARVVLATGEGGTTVNLREGPGTNHGRIKAVNVGSTVEIVEDQGAWCKIIADGKTGWMMANHLEYIGEGIQNDVISEENQEKIDKALSAMENALVTISEQIEIIGMINGRG
ncbi:MAG: SH3 domain-containing protein [Clostridia bacterium]|nr:SH3 domain-containing protein [Clostridia bacterium]